MSAVLTRRLGAAAVLISAMAAAGAVAFAQTAAPAEADVAPSERAPHVELIDEHDERFQITEAELAELPVQTLDVADGGRTLTYEGVSLYDVLRHHEIGFGEQLKGRRTPTIMLCEASDDYRAVFALHEIDPDTNDKAVLLAFRCNGEPLPAQEGPFRLLTPGEKRRVRAIRMLTTIRIVNLVDLPMPPARDDASQE